MEPTYRGTPPCLFFQVRLDESQIDDGFKSLFRQLAGPVSVDLLAGQHHRPIHTDTSERLTVSLIVCRVFVPPGHGDQCDRTANHPEQDHQQTSVQLLEMLIMR